MSGFAKRYSFRSGKVHDESCKSYNSRPFAIAACCVLFCLGIGLIIGFEAGRGGVESKPWQQVRLPETLLPIHYDVELQVDVTAFTVVGQVNVTLRCATPTRYVILHAAELDVVSGDGTPGVTSNDGVTVPRITSWFLYTENQYLVLELDKELTKGVVYTVSINFRGTLRDGLIGFYRSSYVNNDGQTRYLATTHMQPMGARLAFPCFDEPAFKATFTVTLVHRDGYTALANMPLENNVTRNDGWIADRFQRSVRMPTYLLAFVVSDYTSVGTVSSSGLETRIWARPEYISAGMGDYALDVADKIVAYYEEYFDVPFPLPKIDHISIPDYSIGAMENWGLITYAESLLLYDTSRKRMQEQYPGTARIVAHELAHMWFGNLVTMEWWDGTWLNEGFASYVEYLGYGYVEPDVNVMEQFAYYRCQGVLEDDSLTSSRPIFQPVNHPDESREIFDSITYSKGASILRMLGNFVGENTFRKGLKSYLERNAYSNAVQDELWEEITLAAREDGQTDLDVKTVMDTWTLQMGYPVVNLTRDYGRGTAQATQQHFLLDPTATVSAPSDFGYRWHIPLTYTTRGGSFDEPDQVWMRPDQGTSTVNLGGAGSDDWVLANIHRVGYYRVNYDPTNWRLLIDHLNSSLYEEIPPDNRGTLIDDAFNLGRASQLDLSIALDLTRYLVRERHFVPWSMAKAAMNYVETVFGSVSDIYNNWQAYMVQLISPFYNEVGWTLQQSDYNTEVGQVLAISTACTYGQTGCVNNATALFQRWMDTNNNSHIPETFKSTVYCTAIRYGGSREWDFAWQRYLEAEPSEQNLLLSAMACSRDTVILSRYLERSKDAALVRRQSAPDVISYVGGSDVGKTLAWNFLVDNWDFYMENYDETQFTMASIVSSVTKQFSAQEDLDNLEQFLKDHPNQGTATRAFSQAVDNTGANLRFRRDNESKIRAWLPGRSRGN
ncbi:aminopeptidase N-like isoform X1 [Branchiostoma floridae]|uniref:Aminopeptidase n=1 Tax=Branchiostoma floridae TaxID=7739 RepID=A0A9J7MTI1_BRAFL|nr:aminopeptidase N-like isoform X1 [Branchiostoma floridae]